jgi:hypothetical protein
MNKKHSDDEKLDFPETTPLTSDDPAFMSQVDACAFPSSHQGDSSFYAAAWVLCGGVPAVTVKK